MVHGGFSWGKGCFEGNFDVEFGMSNRIPYRDMVAHPNKVKYENADPNSHSKAIFRNLLATNQRFSFVTNTECGISLRARTPCIAVKVA